MYKQSYPVAKDATEFRRDYYRRLGIFPTEGKERAVSEDFCTQVESLMENIRIPEKLKNIFQEQGKALLKRLELSGLADKVPVSTSPASRGSFKAHALYKDDNLYRKVTDILSVVCHYLGRRSTEADYLTEEEKIFTQEELDLLNSILQNTLLQYVQSKAAVEEESKRSLAR